MGGLGERSTGQVVAYVAVAVLLAVAGFRYFGGDGEEAPTPVAVEESAGEGSAGEGAGGGAFVHVAGEVRKPGLYRMPVGSRVGDAIERAGGVGDRAELAGVNLAAEVQDGQQVVVPERGAVPSPGVASPAAGTAAEPGASAAGAAGAPAAPISLAQATVEQLDAGVDGIGPVLAGAIVEYRDQNGPVESIDELREVDGIGEERLATLREALVP